MADYFFGDTGAISTPEELARRRRLAHALRMSNVGTMAQNPWEGLNAIASALGGRIAESRLDAVEAAGRQGADEKFRQFLANGLGSRPPADVISDPWMSESQRDFLKPYLQPRSEAPHPMPETSSAKSNLPPVGATPIGIDQGLKGRARKIRPIY
jgi:hypothetical protein